MTVGESRARKRELDDLAYNIHKYMGEGSRGDKMRKMMQAGVVSDQNAYVVDVGAYGSEAGVHIHPMHVVSI